MLEVTIHIPALSELAAAIRGITPAGTPPAPAHKPKTAAAAAEEPAAAPPTPAPAKKAAAAKEKPAPEPEKKPEAPAPEAPVPAAEKKPSADDELAAAKDALRALLADNIGNPDAKKKFGELLHEAGSKSVSALSDLESVKAVQSAFEDFLLS